MKKYASLFFILLFIMGCGGQGTTSVGNSSVGAGTSVIKIGQLNNNGTSRIEMPLEVFGSSVDDLEGASFDIQINGETVLSNLNPEIYYLSASEVIAFILTALEDGDVLVFIIHNSFGAVVIYNGTVSDESDQEGINTSVDTDNGDNAIMQLIGAICEKILFCDSSLDTAICESSLLATFQLTDEFGVPVPENSVNMQAVSDGLDDGTYSYDESHLTQCLSDIDNLTCDDVAGGYENGSLNFENVEELIPEEANDSCPQVIM